LDAAFDLGKRQRIGRELGALGGEVEPEVHGRACLAPALLEKSG